MFSDTSPVKQGIFFAKNILRGIKIPQAYKAPNKYNIYQKQNLHGRIDSWTKLGFMYILKRIAMDMN